MSTPLNLYGIPFRSWLILNQNTSWIRQAEMRQFSSQERNQEVFRKPDLGLFHEVHTGFHLYFVTIVTVLSAIISAFIFLIICWRTYKCFSRGRKGGCVNQKLSALPVVDKRKKPPPPPLQSQAGNSRICQEVSSTKLKTKHLPSVSAAKNSKNKSEHYASYQVPPCECLGQKVDNVWRTLCQLFMSCKIYKINHSIDSNV